MTARTLPADDVDAWVTGQTRAGRHQLLDEMTPHELRAIARHCLQYAPEVTDRAIAERLRARREGNKTAAKGTT